MTPERGAPPDTGPGVAGNDQAGQTLDPLNEFTTAGTPWGAPRALDLTERQQLPRMDPDEIARLECRCAAEVEAYGSRDALLGRLIEELGT